MNNEPKIFDLIIPAWAIGAIINNDYSGLTDAEISKVKKLIAEYGDTCSINGESFFSWHNAIDGNLGADCFDCAFLQVQQTTKQEIKESNDFSGLLKLPGGYELYTLYPGGDKLHYYLFDRDENIIFSGKDFKPGAGRNIDDIQSVVSLLGFLTLKPGDTDSDYFKDYTAAQIAFAISSDCEKINNLVSDFEYSSEENKFYHDNAVKFFSTYYYQDLEAMKCYDNALIFHKGKAKRKVWVFDNEGTDNETFDRFTIVLGNGDLLGASARPFAPGGFGQHSGNLVDNIMHIEYGAGWRKTCAVKKIVKAKVSQYISEARGNVNWLGKEVTDITTLPADVVSFIQENLV